MDKESYFKKNDRVVQIMQPLMNEVEDILDELEKNKDITKLDRWGFSLNLNTGILKVGNWEVDMTSRKIEIEKI